MCLDLYPAIKLYGRSKFISKRNQVKNAVQLSSRPFTYVPLYLYIIEV